LVCNIPRKNSIVELIAHEVIDHAKVYTIMVVPINPTQKTHYQCLIVFAMMNPQVTTCIITQKVLKNKANRASRKVKMGTSGRSSSVCPIRWPVALAQTFSRLFIL
jgi:hypothetical protein